MEILSLGEKIKQKRKEQNMTLKDLAGDKVTPGQISLVESGKSKPSIDLLEYIAQRLNVSIDYILETEEHQAEKLCEYYSKVAEASLLAENYEQTREAINKGIVYAKDYNLEYYIGLNEFYTGKIEFGKKNYNEAQSRFICANEVFFRVKKVRDAVQTYICLGMAAYEQSYYDSAINYYRQAERIINENRIIDNDILIRVYYSVSLCFSKVKNYNSTIDYLLLAMEKFKEKNDKYQYGQSLLMLSISYKSIDKFEEALLYAGKAIQIFEELDNQSLIAKIETDMGIILSDLGNIDDSFKHLQSAYKIKLEIKDKTLIYTMLKLADNYIAVNDYERASDIIDQIYDKFSEDEFGEYRVPVYYYLYKLSILKSDVKNAELYLLNTVKYLQNMDSPKELADIYIMLGEFYKDSENQTEALKFIDKGIDIYKQIGIIAYK